MVQKVIRHHEANGGVSRFEKIKYYHKTFLSEELNDSTILNLADKVYELEKG